MIGTAQVKDFMTREVVTLTPDTEILRAVNTLMVNDIAAAPVVDDQGSLVGILTERDCMRVVLKAGYHAEYGGLVSEYMSHEVDTINAHESIIDVAKLFFGQRFHRYPVMENDQLVGLISRRDVLRALAELW